MLTDFWDYSGAGRKSFQFFFFLLLPGSIYKHFYSSRTDEFVSVFLYLLSKLGHFMSLLLLNVSLWQTESVITIIASKHMALIMCKYYPKDLTYIIIFLKIFLKFIFTQRGREREREGEKHQCVVASCPPPCTGDLAHNPGMCPDQGIKPAMFQFASWHSVH